MHGIFVSSLQVKATSDINQVIDANFLLLAMEREL